MSSQRYRKHAGSVYNLTLHFVWCPKYRKPVLTGAVAERLTDLLHEKAAALDVAVKELEVYQQTQRPGRRAGRDDLHVVGLERRRVGPVPARAGHVDHGTRRSATRGCCSGRLAP